MVAEINRAPSVLSLIPLPSASSEKIPSPMKTPVRNSNVGIMVSFFNFFLNLFFLNFFYF